MGKHEDIKKPIGDFIIENAVATQGVDGAYYHYSEVCKLLKLQQNQSTKESIDETVDDAAEKWVFEVNGSKWSNNDNTAGDNYRSFKEGAKWQQERSYSEEESFENKSLKWWMSLTINEQVEIGFKYDMPTFNLTLRAIMHEFEQFKKK